MSAIEENSMKATGAVNLAHHKQRLLAEERDASARLERAVSGASEPGDGAPHDSGEESSRGGLRYQQLAQAEAARSLLNQVRDALDRIDSGTFGRCAEDGEPIDDARLEAVPWAAFCEKHDRRQPPSAVLRG
jgi:DnaK suppressor protein